MTCVARAADFAGPAICTDWSGYCQGRRSPQVVLAWPTRPRRHAAPLGVDTHVYTYQTVVWGVTAVSLALATYTDQA